MVYFTEMYKIFSELTDQIDQAGLTDEQRERETEAKLTELRALSIVADDWVRKIQKRALFMPLWMDCALFKLFQSSNGQQWPKPDYPFVSLRPHLHPQLLLHYTLIFHHLSNSKQLNATLTKPSAKCNIISQYVVVYFSFSKGIRQILSELINKVTLHGFRGIYNHLFLMCKVSKEMFLLVTSALLAAACEI